MGVPLKSKAPKEVALSIGLELLQTHLQSEMPEVKPVMESVNMPAEAEL
jgi:xanthine/CO dehydrogenase XdhC/CoxF family maturation factor